MSEITEPYRAVLLLMLNNSDICMAMVYHLPLPDGLNWSASDFLFSTEADACAVERKERDACGSTEYAIFFGKHCRMLAMHDKSSYACDCNRLLAIHEKACKLMPFGRAILSYGYACMSGMNYCTCFPDFQISLCQSSSSTTFVNSNVVCRLFSMLFTTNLMLYPILASCKAILPAQSTQLRPCQRPFQLWPCMPRSV